MSKAERDNLARLARNGGKLAKQHVKERQAALRADVEDQLAAEYEADEKIWADITRDAMAEMDKARKKIDGICETWGIPKKMRPGLYVHWYSRGGDSASAVRRSELRKLAFARIESAGQSAIVTIDTKVHEIETELVRVGLESAEAHAFLTALPSAEDLLPHINVGELDGKPQRRPYEPDPKLTGELLTPSNGSAREERRLAIERAVSANPDGSARAIAGMAGVDPKTVRKYLAQGGEIPTQAGGIPTDDGGAP